MGPQQASVPSVRTTQVVRAPALTTGKEDGRVDRTVGLGDGAGDPPGPPGSDPGIIDEAGAVAGAWRSDTDPPGPRSVAHAAAMMTTTPTWSHRRCGDLIMPAPDRDAPTGTHYRLPG